MEHEVGGTIYVLQRRFGDWHTYQKAVTAMMQAESEDAGLARAEASDAMFDVGAAFVGKSLKATRPAGTEPEENKPWEGAIDDLDLEDVLELINAVGRVRAGQRDPFASSPATPTPSSASGGLRSEEAVTPESPSETSP